LSTARFLSPDEEVSMKTRSGVTIGLLATMLFLVPAAAWAGDGAGEWEIEGTWIDRSVALDGWGVMVTITRTGGNEYQMVTDYAGPPPWPGEVKRSVMVGPLWKVGPKEWGFTGIAYLLDEYGLPVWTMVTSGTWTMVGPDEVVTDDWYISLYAPSRDASYILGGGPPDFPPGTPYGPMTGGMYRIPHITLSPPGP
jgi:hypothetical protein